MFKNEIFWLTDGKKIVEIVQNVQDELICDKLENNCLCFFFAMKAV